MELEPIAVVGMSAVFPGPGDTIDAFWQLICQRQTARTEVPASRFNIDGFYHPNGSRLDSVNAKHGSFIERDLADFDAAFFTISAAEAACLDPQQRILLETTYRALENAGIPMDRIVGSNTSTYIAGHSHDWEIQLSRDPAVQDRYQATGSGTAVLAGRISHFFDLRGPCLVLDTACSSSGYAIHLACQSLRNKESDMSIVAGSNMVLTPEALGLAISNGGFLSPDGICYSYDDRANGYARGEGFASIVLKPLSKAIRDGDTIRSLIRATGVNQDGRTPSITQPSAGAQERLIKDTYRRFGLDLGVTGFFEAHGTGTKVGDRIEASAIGACFRDFDSNPELVVGSVKSNLGHLEGVSGLASLVKSTLALETGLIPPNMWLERVNPEVNAEYNRIKVPRAITTWPKDGIRRASINNFGYSGSNAHVVLDDVYHYLKEHHIEGARHVTPASPLNAAQFTEIAQRRESSTCTTMHPTLLVLSASDKAGPVRQAKSLQAYLSDPRLFKGGQQNLADVAFTLSERRSKLPWRSFLLWEPAKHSPDQIASSFSSPIQASGSGRVVLTFTGQGAKEIRVDKSLLGLEVVRKSVERSEACLQKLGCCWSLSEELTKRDEHPTPKGPVMSQTLTTCLQLALVDALAAWKVVPHAVIGHSSGEIAGAYAAGSLVHEDAVKIAYLRGSLAQELINSSEKSAMLAVGTSEAQCVEMLGLHDAHQDIYVGCINSPNSTTLTGSLPSLQEAKTSLTARGVFSSILQTGIAYHSTYMSPMTSEYERRIGNLQAVTAPPFGQEIPTFSSVSSQQENAVTLRDAKYWSKNLTSPVKFSGAFDVLLDAHQAASDNRQLAIIELGPYGLLKQPLFDILGKQKKASKWTYQSVLDRSTPSLQSTLNLAGHLFANGFPIDLCAVNQIERSECQVVCNLPEYPFNHSSRHWHESQRSLNFRSRNKGRHELLGTRPPDWNPDQPQWRNLISTKEMPWLADHKLKDSQPLYPAGGFLAAAIEAVRDLSESKQAIASYRLRNVHYMRPLLIDENNANEEWQLFLTRTSPSSTESLPWYNFKIYSMKRGEYSEACSGEIRGESHDLSTNGFTKGSRYECRRSGADDSYSQHVESGQFYQDIWDMGYEYGPFFRLLKDLRFNGQGEASATLNLRDWADKLDSQDFQPSVIHPTTLDAFFQLPIITVTEGGRRTVDVMAAGSTEELWISSSLLQQDNIEMSLQSSKKSNSSKSFRFDISAYDTSRGTPLVYVKGHAGAFITGTDKTLVPEVTYPTLGYQMAFKPSMALATRAEQQALLAAHETSLDEPSDEYIDQMEGLSLYFFKRMEAKGKPQIPPKQSYLESWWQALQVYCDSSNMPQRRVYSPERVEEIVRQSNAGPPTLRAIVKIASQLDRIFADETTALQVLFEGGLASEIYATGMQSLANKAACYVQLLAHESPDLRIAEIGAGTGSLTEPILSKLTHEVGNNKQLPCFSEYTFTDIGAAFLEPAKERFSQYGASMSFKVLDISSPPPEDQFTPGSYDVVVAAAVLHATRKLGETLKNCRKLLRPGGKIIMLEPCVPSRLAGGFVFGLVPGWWASQDDFRQHSPLVEEDRWSSLLQEAGFSGVDMAFKDHDDPEFHNMSVLVSTAVESPAKALEDPALRLRILVDETSTNRDLASKLQSQLAKVGWSDCELCSILDGPLKAPESTVLVSLLDLDRDFVEGMDESQFEALKPLVLQCHRIFWLNRGAGGPDSDPYGGKMVGFGRTVCSERGEMAFKNLVFSAEAGEGTLLDLTVRLLSRELTGNDSAEIEFHEQNGLWEVGRLVPNVTFNEGYTDSAVTSKEAVFTIGEGPPPDVHLTIDKTGLLDDLHYVERQGQPELGEDEVQVEIKATSLNFVDVLTALGQVPGDALGWDAAGIVVQAGPKSSFKPGDRVICAAATAFGTLLTCSPHLTWPMPDGMDFPTAASLLTIYATAWYSLVTVARIQPTDTILIHAGAGGVGQAAIQICQMLGVRNILVTVGTPLKKTLLREIYALPAAHIYSSRDESFVQGVLQTTNGRGVDIALNCVAGELLQQTFQCLAPLGKMIEIGKRDMLNETGLRMGHFLHNVTFASVNLAMLMKDFPAMVKDIFNEVLPFFSAGKLHEPRPLHTFRASQAADAFRLLQKGQGAGKVVIDFETKDTIKYLAPSKPSWVLNSEASYLIAGGLGGLGRIMVQWMCSRGAKSIIILSRSGRQHAGFAELDAYAKQSGLQLTVEACDITNAASLASALDAVKTKCPPIRGCINATMLIRDGLIKNMAFAPWSAGWRVKVHGSRNLLTQLPPTLDFCILLSSLNGIVGSIGASNYVLGNAYQDALAHAARRARRTATTIDLGVQLDAGFLADAARAALARQMAPRGFTGIRADAFLRQLEAACAPAFRDPARPEHAQLITGLDAPVALRAKGFEPPDWMARPALKILHNYRDVARGGAAAGSGAGGTDHAARVRAAAGVEEAARLVLGELAAKLSKTMAVAVEEFDESKPGFMLGVDSLIAIELRNWFQKQFRAEVTVFSILQDRSVAELCREIAKQFFP